MTKNKTEAVIENGFKETEIGLIPSDWDVKEFKDCVDKESISRDIKIPQGKFSKIGKYPIIDQGADFIAGYTDDENKLYAGNLPVIVFGDHTRIFKFIDFQFSVGADGTKLIQPKDFLYPKYFFYYLCSLSIPSKGYNRHYKYLKENFIAFPQQKSEQQKIASVLSKNQQAIEHQDKIIEKTKELKRSLMHRLFTYGLRGEELKETEIGLMPESWRIEKAEEYCERVTDGTHDSPKSSETGFYLVTSKNLKNGRINFNNCYFVSESDYNEINKRSKVDIYDVLFGMIGTLGSPVLIREEPSYAIKNVGLFKNNKDELKGLWLYHYLSTDMVASLVDKQKAGATQKYIPLWFLRSFPVAVPSDEEMKEIVNMLEILEQKLSLEELQCNLFKVLFKSMLQLLMTGQVRVKDIDFGVDCE